MFGVSSCATKTPHLINMFRAKMEERGGQGGPRKKLINAAALYHSVPRGTTVYQWVSQCTTGKVYEGIPKCTALHHYVPLGTPVYGWVSLYTTKYHSVPQ